MLLAIDDEYREEALLLLQWLAYAKSPLTLSELAEATIIDPDDGNVETANRGSPEDTLDILAGLITVVEDDTDEGSDIVLDSDSTTDSVTDVRSDSRSRDSDSDALVASQENISGYGEGYGNDDNIARSDKRGSTTTARKQMGKKTRVTLAHYSVKEYLESERASQSKVKRFHLSEGEGHRVLAQSCLAYLMHYSDSEELKSCTKQDLLTFPILHYAAHTWFYHSLRQESGDVSREIAFLGSEKARGDWTLVHLPEYWWMEPFEGVPDYRSGSALYYASYLNLKVAVDGLPVAGYDQGGYHGSALHAAAMKGNDEIVRLLINRKEDVNAFDESNGSVLYTASARGHETVVRILIDAGADVNDILNRSGHYPLPIIGASMRGHKTVVEMLIAAGADINAQISPDREFYITGGALHYACFNGHVSVVKMLIEAGVDINAGWGIYPNALLVASLCGFEEIVKILLENGADDAQGGLHNTALEAASSMGHKKIVKMLLEHRADPNAREREFAGALYAASKDGWVGVVRMLLDWGGES